MVEKIAKSTLHSLYLKRIGVDRTHNMRASKYDHSKVSTLCGP